MSGTVVQDQAQIVALPFRVEKLSFDAKWSSERGVQLDLDLTCCCFDAEGKLRSFAGPGHSSAEDGGVQHQSGADGDTIVVYPSKIDPHCEALFFVLSASDSEVCTMNLSSPDTLQFNGHSAELDAGLEPMFQCDLKSNASWIAADSQSVAICAMHRSTDSWVTSFSLLPQPSHSWGHFLPELRAGLAQLPGFPVHKLVAAQDGIVDKVVLLRKYEDRKLEALSCSGQAVQKVRLDFGWEGALSGEGIEGVDMEWNALCYDITGEQTQAVSSKSKEADGIAAVPDPPPPEEEETPAETEPEGEEDGEEPKGEAEAEQKLPVPAKDPDAFPLKDGIIIDFAALPSATRSIVITINNFAGEGLGPLTCAHLRLTDVSAPEEAQHKSMGWFRFPSPVGAHKDRPTVVMAKLYKEGTVSAFSQWRAAASNSDLAGFLADTALVRGSLANISKQQTAAAQLAKAIADRTEAGEDVPDDLKAQERGQWQWRLGCMGRPLAGAALEESAEELKGIANFEGRFDQQDKRHDDRAKAVYSNGDTFFGQYDNDRRQGVGLYLVAKGGGYAGNYDSSKRSGAGIMRLPDGGMYQGQFAGDKFEGQGQYEYVNGSTYVGEWKAGKKHGQGVYWDTNGGCLRATWENGTLKGQGIYDQPSYQFKGNFKANLPEGECSFTICAHRTLGMPARAATHILAEHGPVMQQKGNYTLPPGVGAEPPADGEPASEDVVAPAYPKYEGLAFKSSAALPDEAADLFFPPSSAAKPAVIPPTSA